mgnify:CR=1 FL=1|tara:strand:- start:136 stop:414 length:279 start_codon:yes stop_codon:yes gene_type:complete
MTIIGFSLQEYADKKKFNHFITTDLKFAILDVSEATRRKSKKVRALEAIVRQCMKYATLEGWTDEVKTLTKMLETVADIKYDCSDVVRGYDW